MNIDNLITIAMFIAFGTVMAAIVVVPLYIIGYFFELSAWHFYMVIWFLCVFYAFWLDNVNSLP